MRTGLFDTLVLPEAEMHVTTGAFILNENVEGEQSSCRIKKMQDHGQRNGRPRLGMNCADNDPSMARECAHNKLRKLQLLVGRQGCE